MTENTKFILNILENLTREEMRKLELLLKDARIENCDIPSNKLEKLNACKATKLFTSCYKEPLKALKDILDDIPKKDLSQKIHDKIEADMKNEDEAQNNEKFAFKKPSPGSSDRPPYTGTYTLFDLQDYATKNQDQLIMHLENILKPDEFNALKKELMCSVLNNSFSFTAQKYYEFFRSNELNEFLKNVTGESKKIPMKLLNFLFSKKKNNPKRKAQEQMQREGNNGLKRKQLASDDDDDDVPDKATLGIENEKKKSIHSTEHKPGNEDNNSIAEHCPVEKKIPVRSTEHKCGNEDNNSIAEHCPVEKKIPVRSTEHKRGNEDNNSIAEHCPDEKNIPVRSTEHKHGNEDNNLIAQHCLDKDSRMAIEKWKKERKMGETSLNYICIHKHEAYHCFIAQDVLQFKLPGDSDYRILAILQDKRDFTNSRKLKKKVEFALQFNMAVLDVQVSEVISSKGFVCERRANTFAEAEFFLKNIVFEIVLPVLALYKWVKLNAFENAVYPNKESKSFSEKKLQM